MKRSRTTTTALPPTLAPAGLTREQAAAYIGVSARHFDGMVKAGTMPQPRRSGGRHIHLVRELNTALAALPVADGNEPTGSVWDLALARGRA